MPNPSRPGQTTFWEDWEKAKGLASTYAEGVRTGRWAMPGQVSTDSASYNPIDQTAGATAGVINAVTPRFGTDWDVQGFKQDVSEGNYGQAAARFGIGTAGAALDFIDPGAGHAATSIALPLLPAAARARRADEARRVAAETLPPPPIGHNAPPPEAALAPQFAERYPQAGGWEWKTDPKKPEKGPYQGKLQTDEERTLMAARKQAEKDMEGGYTPYFDPEKRAMVDPANYPTDVNTTVQARGALPKTQARFEAMARNPEGMERLRQAFQQGLDHADVKDWYGMKQLEDKFIQELGPEAGRKAFQEKFANAMSATTAGASPKENFLMAMYGNYRRQHGLGQVGEGKGYEIPSPMGGQYAQTNLDMHLDPKRKWGPFDVENPKRHDFEYSFLGHDKAVVDKQMMQLFDPKLDNPGKGYGHYSEVMADLAKEYGVSPQEFQAIAWMGSKATKDPNYVPHPMISTVNDAIERTRRVTGMDPDEIVRRGIVRSEIPIYSLALPGAGLGLLAAQQQQEEQGKPPMPTWWRKPQEDRT